MLLADAALSATFGLVIVFVIGFPALVTGLIAYSVAQALGERAENQRHQGRWGRRALEAREHERSV
jgi:hypothetical protein